jgi:hypothetical protein
MKNKILVSLLFVATSAFGVTNTPPEIASKSWVSNYVAGFVNTNNATFTNISVTNLTVNLGFPNTNFNATSHYTFNLMSQSTTVSVMNRVSVWIDQDASGSYEETNSTWFYQFNSANGIAKAQLSAWMKPNARFIVTNENWGSADPTNLSTRVLLLGQ